MSPRVGMGIVWPAGVRCVWCFIGRDQAFDSQYCRNVRVMSQAISFAGGSEPTRPPPGRGLRRWLVREPEFAREAREARVRRPDFQAAYDRRRQEVDIDPPDAAALQPSMADEGHDLLVPQHGGLVHLPVAGQQIVPPAAIPDEQLTVYQVVADDVIAGEELVQPGGVGRSIGEKANPDRRIHEHHQANPRRVAPVRRRVTSRA